MDVMKKILAIALLIICLPLLAETRYIVSQEPINILAKPYPKSAIIASVSPQASVILLATDRSKGFALIRLNHQEGWVPLENLSAKHENPNASGDIPREVFNASPQNEWQSQQNSPTITSEFQDESILHNSIFRVSVIVLCTVIIGLILPKLRSSKKKQ